MRFTTPRQSSIDRVTEGELFGFMTRIEAKTHRF
jgi:hypothetical protein